MIASSAQTHVCVVSEQAIPNLTPALDSRIRPQRVVLVASDARMQLRAAWLRDVLTTKGLEVVIELLGSENFSDMRQRFADIVERYPDATLNATGGKKTMTLAAFDAFRAAGRAIFYVETNNHLNWLVQGNTQGLGLELQGIKRIEDYFAAYGYQVIERKNQNSALYQKDYCSRMIERASHYLRVAPRIQPEGLEKMKSLCCPVNGDNKMVADVTELLDFAVSRGLVKKQQDRYLATSQQVFFIKGGWLEELVFAVIQSHRMAWGIDDLCFNLKLSAKENPDIKNEFDVAVLRNNRIYLIECKAASNSDGVQNFIYKLDSARKSGGLMAEAMLINWAAVATEGGKRMRADNNRIALLGGDDLKSLELKLHTWLLN